MNIFLQRKQHDADAERFFPALPLFLSYLVFYAVLLLLFFLNILPTGYASFTGLQPAFLFAAVFYWSIFYPALLPFWLVFSLGFGFDLLVGLPAGGTALILLSAQWLLRTQQRFLLGQGFWALWLCFALLCYVALFAQWALFSLFSWHVMPLLPVVVNSILTIALFPFTVVVFHRIRALILNARNRQQEAGSL